MIRKATPNDLIKIVDLGVEALEKTGHKGFIIDREKITAIARKCISSPSDFVWVSEIDKNIVAAVTVSVCPMTCYIHKQASVVQFYSKKNGEGIKLIKQLIKWWESRPGLKTLVFTLECDVDERTVKLLKLLGFSFEFPVMSIMR